MKKTILIFALFFFTVLNIKAQSYLINEDFSSSTSLPTGWTNNMISGITTDDYWMFGKHPKFFFGPQFDNKYAIFDSYNGGSAGGTATNGQGENVALETPSVNTTGLSNLYLSFDYMELYNGGRAILEYSLNGGSSWTTYTTYTAVTSTPVRVVYNISSYVGNSAFKLRIRWDNTSNYTYSGYFAIDNFQLFSRYATDATITGIDPMYDKSCPSASQQVNVVIKNAGTNSISNIPVTVNVSGAATATLNYTYTGSLASDASINVNVGNINTTAGGSVNFSATVNYSGDGYTTNDNFKTTRVSAGIAGNPVAKDGSACAKGSRVSIGVVKNAGDSTFWYNQSSGGSIIGEGNPFLTPPLNGTTTFYAQNARLFNNDQSAFQGPYRFNGIQYSGSFFNINASNEILIDSFWQQFAYPGAYTVSVYYKTGTYSGYESNSSAWTFHQSVSITSRGFGHMVGLKLTKPINIPAGNLYGFYILADGNTTQKCVTFKSGTLSYSNADLTINCGSVSNAQFTGISGYSWDGSVFYRKLCLSNRVAVKAEIKPSPTGASMIKSTPFEGIFDAGSVGSPDLLKLNQTNTYEFTPPTGYNNAGHITKWKINYVELKTPGGKTLPISDYSYAPPTSSTNAILSFKGHTKYLDSNITIIFNFSDLGPYFCDSTVKRVIRIVPTPKSDFTFNSPTCDGTPVVFENKSKIHSGNLTQMWYFGDGDSSDIESPIHVYATHGTYCVKLVTTSLPYKITHDTTICVVVTEIPKIEFKVFNACIGDSLSFSNSTSISAGKINYKWDFGDGKTSAKVNPKHKYTLAGTYQVTLEANSNGCKSLLTKKAHQFVRPVANFSVTGNCSKTEILFNNLTTIGLEDQFGNNWKFGDGGGNNQSNPTHVYTTPGTKVVKYVATSQFGCTDSMTKTITILPSPEASFSNGPVCNVKPVIFNNTSLEPLGILTSYTWDFGDGSNFSNNKNPQHNYPNLGSYTIKLTATGNNGCKTMFEKEVTVLQQPIASFSALDACLGHDVIFTNKTKGGGIINYKWKFGDGDSSNFFSPVKRYKETIAQTYNVTLSAKNLGGCEDVITLPVNIKESPICGFSIKSAGTGGFEYKFTPPNMTYPFYQWSFEGGGSSNLAVPTHRFPGDGKYKVRVFMKTVDGCDCVDSSQFVTVYHLGTNKFGSKSGIEFYPNPNNGHFNLQVSTLAPTETFTLNILDLAGKVISTSLLAGNQKHNLVYDELANGLYTLEIIKQSGERTTAKMNILK